MYIPACLRYRQFLDLCWEIHKLPSPDMITYQSLLTQYGTVSEPVATTDSRTHAAWPDFERQEALNQTGENFMQIRAAVLNKMALPRPYTESLPLAIESLTLAGPGRGEVLVKMHAAGLCHSDLSTINGDRPRP